MAFNISDRKLTEKPEIEERYFTGSSSFSTLSSYINGTTNPLKLSAVYAAVNILSNAVATLSLNIHKVDENGFKSIDYTHPCADLLNKQPSNNLSRFNFFKQVITSVILSGNGYAVLQRDKKNVITSIRFVHPDSVTPYYDEVNDIITYVIRGYDKPIESVNVLHFFLHTHDLINGISVIDYAVNTLKISADSDNHSGKYMSSGMLNGILTSKVKMNPVQMEEALNSWTSLKNRDSNTTAFLPDGFEYTPISISPRDAMVIEQRVFNVIEVCRYMNVSPSMVYDHTHSSYSSLEMTQLQFLQNSVNPYLLMIEQEINRKVFTKKEQQNFICQFAREELISTDSTTKAKYFNDLLSAGVITVNECRKALNMNDIENGNHLFMPLNTAPIEHLIDGQLNDKQSVIQQKVKDPTNPK